MSGENARRAHPDRYNIPFSRTQKERMKERKKGKIERQAERKKEMCYAGGVCIRDVSVITILSALCYIQIAHEIVVYQTLE